MRVDTTPMLVQLPGPSPSAATVKNNGPGTLYYRSVWPVSSATNDGSLVSGASSTFSAPQWVVTLQGAPANIDVASVPPVVVSGPPELAFAESLSNGTAVSTVYTTTLTDYPGLVLPQVVIGAAPVMLSAGVLLSCSTAAATAVAGIWEGVTELQRAFTTVDTAAKYVQINLSKRLPPGDGVTPRDFRVCFGLLASGGTIVPSLGQTGNPTSATFSIVEV